MFNKSLPALLIISAFISGCQSNPSKTTEAPQASYMNMTLLDCPDIVRFHKEAQVEMIELKEERATKNAASVAVGIIGMMAGVGAFAVQSSSQAERDLEIQITALETVADEKQCELVQIDPDELKNETNSEDTSDDESMES